MNATSTEPRCPTCGKKCADAHGVAAHSGAVHGLHHSRSTYVHKRCACEVCKAAERDYRRAYRARGGK